MAIRVEHDHIPRESIHLSRLSSSWYWNAPRDYTLDQGAVGGWGGTTA